MCFSSRLQLEPRNQGTLLAGCWVKFQVSLNPGIQVLGMAAAELPPLPFVPSGKGSCPSKQGKWGSQPTKDNDYFFSPVPSPGPQSHFGILPLPHFPQPIGLRVVSFCPKHLANSSPVSSTGTLHGCSATVLPDLLHSRPHSLLSTVQRAPSKHWVNFTASVTSLGSPHWSLYPSSMHISYPILHFITILCTMSQLSGDCLLSCKLPGGPLLD